MKLIIYLLVTIISIVSSSCEKEKTEIDKLPPITQHGANTFGCLIDGKAFVPKDGEPRPGTIPPPDMRGVVVSNRSSIELINAKVIDHTTRTGLFFLIRYPVGLDKPSSIGRSNGKWLVKRIDTTNITYDDKIGTDYNSFFDSGEITITKFDSVNKIISGVFEAKIVSSENKYDTLNITNGRFDLKDNTK